MDGEVKPETKDDLDSMVLGGEEVLNKFKESQKNSTDPYSVDVIWSAYRIGPYNKDFDDVEENYNRSVAIHEKEEDHRYILLINRCNIYKYRAEYYFILQHEMCHLLEAKDHYHDEFRGFNKDGTCQNEGCIECHPDLGYSKRCIMFDPYDESEGFFLCDGCKNTISDYLNTTSQAG